MTTLPHNNLGMNQIHNALGAGNNQQCSLNDSDFRSLAGRSSGTIHMSDFRGKQVGGGGGAHEGLREIFVRDYHNENKDFFNGKHHLHNYTTFKVYHHHGSHGIHDFFSVEWKGFLTPFVSGHWTFWTYSDDGSYVYINDHIVVNNGGAHGPREVSASIHLQAGTTYKFQTFYGEIGGGAIMRMDYQPPGYSRINGDNHDALTYFHHNGHRRYFTTD